MVALVPEDSVSLVCVETIEEAGAQHDARPDLTKAERRGASSREHVERPGAGALRSGDECGVACRLEGECSEDRALSSPQEKRFAECTK